MAPGVVVDGTALVLGPGQHDDIEMPVPRVNEVASVPTGGRRFVNNLKLSHAYPQIPFQRTCFLRAQP
jgi:hypothetical protein